MTYLDPASKTLLRGKMSAFPQRIRQDNIAHRGGLYPFCFQIKHGCISLDFKIHFLIEVLTGTVVETYVQASECALYSVFMTGFWSK